MAQLSIKKGSSRKSAYDLRRSQNSEVTTHTLSILVDNEAGALARVIGLFSGRGYNIESLNVAEVDHTGHRSRITIVTTGRIHVIEQIIAQVDRLIPVHEVVDLTRAAQSVERELALFVVNAANAGDEGRIRESVKAQDAEMLQDRNGELVIEKTGTPLEIDRLFDLLRPLGLREIVRTGVVGASLDG